MTLLEKRVGVCSQKFDRQNKHILLWDFDRASLDDITISLLRVQRQYKLPTVIIIQSSSKGSFHAYSFTARSFREVIHIIASVPEIDITYLRLGMVRGYFTLRITPRKHEPNFKIVRILSSKYPDEMILDDMTVNEYLTANKGVKNAKG